MFKSQCRERGETELKRRDEAEEEEERGDMELREE